MLTVELALTADASLVPWGTRQLMRHSHVQSQRELDYALACLLGTHRSGMATPWALRNLFPPVENQVHWPYGQLQLCPWNLIFFLTLRLFCVPPVSSSAHPAGWRCLFIYMEGRYRKWCNMGGRSFWAFWGGEGPVSNAPGTNLSSIFYLCGFGQVTYTVSASFFCKIRMMKVCHKVVERVHWGIYTKHLA